MTGFPKALFVSVAVHAGLAAALGLYLDCLPPLELPRLDLSAVEISFAEEERPEVQPVAPVPEAAPQPPPEPEPEPPPPEPEPEPPPPEPEPEPPPPEPEPEPPPPAPEPEPSPPEPEPEPPSPEPAPPPPEPIPETPPPAAPKQARIDAPPRPLKTIRPDYPKGARQRNEEGDVALELAIDAKGRVESVRVVASCGYPELDAAAVRAAERARFAPARAGRKAVAAAARITITFRLSRASEK